MSDRDTALTRDFSAIDWSSWQAHEEATLCFVIREGQILLIRKKRGLGAGKINGPGGRLEAGETPLECALRETREEVGVEATGAEFCGELRFQFTDGYKLHGYVFKASGCEGTASESDEAVPIWTALDAIPFAEMWEDDVLWFPHMLAGRHFSGRFLFAHSQDADADAMLGYELDVSSDA